MRTDTTSMPFQGSSADLGTQGKASTRGQMFRDGLVRVSPLLIGIFPFAVIAGSTAVAAGLTTIESIGFSLIIFAGAAQLAALELIGANAPIFVILITAWIINLRMLIYSAAIAPHFRDLSQRWRGLLAYLLTDQAFVLSAMHYEDRPNSYHKHWYYLGVATALWSTWQLGSVLGIAVGAHVPASWSLDFAIPLTFIALLVPSIRDRGTAGAALGAGIGVALFSWIPLNLGFVLAIFLGVLVATWTERRQS